MSEMDEEDTPQWRLRGERQARVREIDAPETCGKCRDPFDPTDTRWDGKARYPGSQFCRECVDWCHDNDSAEHRCVICARY